MLISKNKLKYTIKYYLTIVLTFLFVYGIPFTFSPINSSKIIFLILFTLYIIKIFFNKINFRNLNKSFITLIILFTLLILYSLIISINTWDMTMPYTYFIILVEFLLGSYFLYRLFLSELYENDFYKLIIIITFIQALIIILMFVNIPFREFIFTFTNTSAEALTERYGGFRGFGLAGSLTYDLSILLSIGMIFISYYLVSFEIKTKELFILSVIWLIIFVAIVLTARSGFIGVIFSILFLLLNLSNNSSRKFLLILMTTFVCFLGIIFFIFQSLYPTQYEILIYGVIPRAFEMFFNYFNEGGFHTSSSDVLMKMYFDVSEQTYFFGDGYFMNPSGDGYYMRTDAGYMRHLLFFGLFGSLVLYSTYLYGFSKMLMLNKKNNMFLVIFLFFYFFIAQYKGNFMTGSPMNIKLYFILLIFIIHNKKRIKPND